MNEYPVPTRTDTADAWTHARLVEPSTSGFVHIGASSGPWRLPIALPRSRRRALLERVRAAAALLQGDPRVRRADLFRGLLRPPGGGGEVAGSDVPDADFDVVLLVETTTVAAAAELLDEAILTGLSTDLDRAAERTLVFTGANVRRIAPVDHDRPGIFLFNYFSADDVDTNLFAWQYTAGWFQDQTGLDNSTVLRPVDQGAVPYTLVNHCRWDRLRDVLPSLLFTRSFRDFVLRTFASNRVVPRPILYTLDRG